MKRQPSEWEKIIANETTDKGLISKMYKQFIQLNPQRNQTTSSKSGKKYLNRHFSKEDIQVANKREKITNIAHYQRNADQNYNEISPHISQNGHHQKVYKQ